MRQPRAPLGPIQKTLEWADKIGLYAHGTEQEIHEALNERLAQPSGEFCRCGNELPRFATGGGTCPPCVEARESQITEAERARSTRMAKIHVPPVYHHCTIGNFNFSPSYSGLSAEALDEYERWIKQPRGNLFLYGGDPGTGKTHLATAALYSLENGGRRCWWTSAMELAQNLDAERNNPERPTFVKSSRVEILLVDDLGAEDKIVFGSGEKVDGVLEERFRFSRPTIVTSNLTVDQLYQRNARVASRLGAAVAIELLGPDRRKEGR